MPQAEATHAKPYIKYYSDEEIRKMIFRYIELKSKGEKNSEEALHLLNEIPVSPKEALGMKKILGIDYIINSGVNCYQVVEKFGYGWFE